MSYSYDITTDIGRVRIRLGDATGTVGDPATYTFEDDEITELLTVGGSVDGATAQGIRILLVDAARRAKSFSLKGLSMNDTARLSALREMLAVFGGDMPTASVIFPALLPSDRGYTEI